MPRLIILFCLLFSFFSEANEVGFKNGNVRTSVKIQGDILVVCEDQMGTQFGNFHCEDNIMVPSEFDYFNGPEGVAADEITLMATHEDGSVRSNTQKYESKKQQSVKQFNLWISSLLQRPLLKMGQNNISFTLKQNGKVTSVGDFKALVQDGGVKTCTRRGHYQSNIGNDCVAGSQRFCDQFFSENKYCLK
ncbi:MAG: hypothetical protein ACXVCP_07610 [Bdellovibrio sp.]